MSSSEILRIAFAVLICADFAGNILVCLVVRRFPFMKTPTNYLLVHLAVCDMMMGLLFLPRHVLHGIYEHPDGLTGDLLCKFVTFGNLAWLVVCEGVFTLVVIAWERYIAIMKPMQSRFSKRHLKFAIAFCWLIGLLVTLPETVSLAYNPRIKSCDFLWKVDWGSSVAAGIWLSTVCCIPFLIMTVLYGGVIRRLCFHHGIADVSQRSLKLSRKRITATAVIVTIVLFLCFMPNSLYYFITTIWPKTSSTVESLQKTGAVFYPVSHLLILLNSSINPVIYTLQSTRFRRCMTSILCGGLQNGHRIRNSLELRTRNRDGNQQLSEFNQKS